MKTHAEVREMVERVARVTVSFFELTGSEQVTTKHVDYACSLLQVQDVDVKKAFTKVCEALREEADRHAF